MIDVYTELVDTLRREGAARNAPEMALGEIERAEPLCLRVGGIAVREGILAPFGMTFEIGDTVAVQRIGEDFVILQKVVEV